MKPLNLALTNCLSLFSLSVSAAGSVDGAAQSGDQSAQSAGHQPGCTEGLCAALTVTTGTDLTSAHLARRSHAGSF